MERDGTLGYFAFAKESTRGTPVTPTIFLPLYEDNFGTNANMVLQQPAYGGKFLTYDVLPGQRDHMGDVTVLAEPNTTAHLINMLLTKTSTTGSGPYTHVFEFSATANPKSYTVDISTGNIVKRFWGFEASKIAPVWNSNEMQHKLSASATGSFQGRTISAVSTTEITLDTTYDPEPTKGLVEGDLVRIYKASDGSTLDTTISSVDDGTTVTLGASAAAFAQGDIIHLRPATPSYNLLPTFLWDMAQFRFSDTAANALTADQTQVEVGSIFEITHPFEDDGGAKRSGSRDPAALVRKAGDATLTIKKFFDTPEDVQAYQDMMRQALAIRHYSGATSQYEYRPVFHSFVTDEPLARIKPNEIEYATMPMKVAYNKTDGKALTVTVINGLSSI